MVSDLQINIELAKALGWKRGNTPYVPNGHFTAVHGVVECLDAGLDVFYKRLDYRDPVVFVAICKHWGITTQFRQNAAVLCHDDFSVDYVPSDSIEKAAALLVIDLVKRGIK